MKTTIEYKYGEDILDIIQETLYELYRGKIEFNGSDPKNEILLYTGIGGKLQFDKVIKEMMFKSGLIVIPDISFTGLDFTSYTIPFLATVKCCIDNTYDPKDYKGEYISGYPLSSYNYRIVCEKTRQSIEITCIGKLTKYYKITKWINKLLNIK